MANDETHASDPTAADAIRELRCLVRWGLRNWKLAVILSLFAAGAIAVKVYKRPPRYTSTVIIDVRDSQAFSEGAPPSSRELTKFIMGVALADTQLIEIAEKLGYDLGPTIGGKPIDLEMFRDAIGLGIYYDAAPQTMYIKTRIGLRFTAAEPDRSLAGARALAEHIVSFQNRGRKEDAALQHEMALENELGIGQRLQRAEAGLMRLMLERTQAPPASSAELTAKIVALQNEVEQLREMQDSAAKRTHQSVLRGDFERDASGLGYEIVDRGHLPPPNRLTQLDTAVIAGVAIFLGLLPVWVLALGGLTFRVYDRDSLRRLGLVYFGQGYVATPQEHSMLSRSRLHRRGPRA